MRINEVSFQASHDPKDKKQLSEESKLKVLSSLCTCKFRTIQAFGKAVITREKSSHTSYNLHEEVHSKFSTDQQGRLLSCWSVSGETENNLSTSTIS